MREIKFELSNGRYTVICRFYEEDNSWSAMLMNMTTFKCSKLIAGTQDQLSMLVTILLELDRERVFKEEETVSSLAKDFKKRWRIKIKNNIN